MSATSARAPSSKIPHQSRTHSQLTVTSEAFNLPPAPRPQHAHLHRLKDIFQLQEMNLKHFYFKKVAEGNIQTLISDHRRKTQYLSFLFDHILTCVSSLWRIWSDENDHLDFFCFILIHFCVLGEQRGLWCFHSREPLKKTIRNQEQRMFLLPHSSPLQTPAVFISDFLFMLTHYSSRFQENLRSRGSPWSSCKWNTNEGRHVYLDIT